MGKHKGSSPRHGPHKREPHNPKSKKVLASHAKRHIEEELREHVFERDGNHEDGILTSTHEEELPVTLPSVRYAPDEDFTKAVLRSRRHLEKKYNALPKGLYNLLLPQSIVGHAQQGHVGFNKRFTKTIDGLMYPNTTTEDVLEALKIPFENFWSERQSYIDEIRVFLSRAIRDPSDKRVRRPVNKHGRYLAGCSLVSEFKNTQEVIDYVAGFLYASRMDTYHPWRQRMNTLFQTNAGGGKTMPIDLDKLKANGLTLVDLATNAHSDAEVQHLVAQGIVIDKPAITSRAVTNGYVRLYKGLGVSDDTAVINAGVFRGEPGYAGALGADFCDTFDKSATNILPGGQDEQLGEFVARESVRYGVDLGLDDLTTITWIALAAIDPAQPTQWLHCSQRYFYETETRLRSTKDDSAPYLRQSQIACPAAVHLRFVQEVRKSTSFDDARKRASRLPQIATSFSQSSNLELYSAYLDRLENFQEKGHIKIF